MNLPSMKRCFALLIASVVTLSSVPLWSECPATNGGLKLIRVRVKYIRDKSGAVTGSEEICEYGP